MEHTKTVKTESTPKARWVFRQESYPIIVPPECLVQNAGVDAFGSSTTQTRAQVTIPIFIRTQFGESFTLKVSEWETVKSVKSIIETRTGLPSEQQRLIYRGHRLGNVDMTLVDYDIGKEAVLCVYRTLDIGTLHLTVRNLRDDANSLIVEPLNTILETKEIYEKATGIPVALQEFIYMGKVLDGDRTLWDYDIMASSVVYVTYRRFPIIAKTMARYSYQLCVSPTTTVWEVKAKIFENRGIPVEEQHIVYDGRELLDDNDLHYYDIVKPYTLLLLVSGKNIEITRKGNGKVAIGKINAQTNPVTFPFGCIVQ
ncbi:polyubiquitin-B-like [Saccoglossus kowalevskii]|uniref:Polyubiquitin-C-like n=1 Tax=Saccoglossus kowalevskii TaxID=10224 RepID=A0ABM0MA94_SACKO|nr:PREDICTED: polyubiquitin-C-like [Saccoglossus kowalevskii]